MKKTVQTKAVLFLGLLFVVVFTSCNKDTMESSYNDSTLIDAIESSTNKVAIEESDLPEVVQRELEGDYSESFTNEAYLAPDLGYVLSLRRAEGTQVGELSKLYFNLSGDAISSEAVGKKGYGKKGKHGINRNECFQLVFPVVFTMPDETVFTVESREGMSVIKDWYVENPDVEEKPTKTFPLDVIYEDSTIVTVSSEEEIMALHEECKSENWDQNGRRCFAFVYPVTHIMSDGTEIVKESADDWDAIKAWYEVNPEVVDKPTLLFPVEVIMSDSTLQTITTEEEMIALRESCASNSNGGGKGNNGGKH